MLGSFLAGSPGCNRGSIAAVLLRLGSLVAGPIIASAAILTGSPIAASTATSSRTASAADDIPVPRTKADSRHRSHTGTAIAATSSGAASAAPDIPAAIATALFRVVSHEGARPQRHLVSGVSLHDSQGILQGSISIMN